MPLDGAGSAMRPQKNVHQECLTSLGQIWPVSIFTSPFRIRICGLAMPFSDLCFTLCGKHNNVPSTLSPCGRHDRIALPQVVLLVANQAPPLRPKMSCIWDLNNIYSKQFWSPKGQLVIGYLLCSVLVLLLPTICFTGAGTGQTLYRRWRIFFLI